MLLPLVVSEPVTKLWVQRSKPTRVQFHLQKVVMKPLVTWLICCNKEFQSAPKLLEGGALSLDHLFLTATSAVGLVHAALLFKDPDPSYSGKNYKGSYFKGCRDYIPIKLELNEYEADDDVIRDPAAILKKLHSNSLHVLHGNYERAKQELQKYYEESLEELQFSVMSLRVQAVAPPGATQEERDILTQKSLNATDATTGPSETFVSESDSSPQRMVMQALHDTLEKNGDLKKDSKKRNSHEERKVIIKSVEPKKVEEAKESEKSKKQQERRAIAKKVVPKKVEEAKESEKSKKQQDRRAIAKKVVPKKVEEAKESENSRRSKSETKEKSNLRTIKKGSGVNDAKEGNGVNDAKKGNDEEIAGPSTEMDPFLSILSRL